MKRLSKRHKLLAGALGFAGVMWAVDSMVGSGAPAPAAAAATTADENTAPVRWEDLTPLIAELTAQPHDAFPDNGQPQRDPFMPVVGAMQAAALAASTPDLSGAAETTTPPEDVISFAELHVLDGVALGRRPVAMIDGRMLPLGARLDGYRLSTILRDQVVFEPIGGGASQTLWLSAPDVPSSRD